MLGGASFDEGYCAACVADPSYLGQQLSTGNGSLQINDAFTLEFFLRLSLSTKRLQKSRRLRVVALEDQVYVKQHVLYRA